MEVLIDSDIVRYGSPEKGSKYFSLIDPNQSSYVSETAYDNTNDVTCILGGKTYYWCESLLSF